jgi:hypothetical protein
MECGNLFGGSDLHGVNLTDAMAEMTIDGSRNILYTRSKAGVIQVGCWS